MHRISGHLFYREYISDIVKWLLKVPLEMKAIDREFTMSDISRERKMQRRYMRLNILLDIGILLVLQCVII